VHLVGSYYIGRRIIF